MEILIHQNNSLLAVVAGLLGFHFGYARMPLMVMALNVRAQQAPGL